MLSHVLILVSSVGCLNNDKSVMSKSYAWRPLGLLPILKVSTCDNTDVEWQRFRRLDLYHRCLDPIIAEINALCTEDKYYRFADNMIRKGRCFFHLLSLDGAEIAAATMCSTEKCPTCECPWDDLDSTEEIYPLRSTADVKRRVEAAQSKFLNPNGSIKYRCKTKVRGILVIVSYIINNGTCRLPKLSENSSTNFSLVTHCFLHTCLTSSHLVLGRNSISS